MRVERILFSMEIRPGTEDEYQRRHDQIWPEMVQALRVSGVANYSLFRRGTEVFGYAECTPDAATAFGAAAATDANRRWAAWFEDVITRLSDEHGNLYRLQEVWHMD
jgi:L-rhamnose mutarotase